MSKLKTVKPFEKAFRKKRLMAFLTTCLALFCLFCFFSSRSIREFASVAELQITSDFEDTHSLIRSVVETETTDQKLSQFVTAAANNADIVANADIATHNLSVIRDSLNIQLSQQKDKSQYVLSVLYRGEGTDCERYLTRTFAQHLARRLDSRISTGQTKGQLRDLIAKIQDGIEESSNGQLQNFESAYVRLNQINIDLSDIHSAIENLHQLSGSNSTLEIAGYTKAIRDVIRTLDQIHEAITEVGQSNGRALEPEAVDIAITDSRKKLYDVQQQMEVNPQTNGPMRVVNTSLPNRNSETSSILATLENIDTDSLQNDIATLKESMRNHAITMRGQLVELQSVNNSVADGSLTVDSIAKLKTTPVNPTPGLSHLMLFGLLSSFLAACVAMSYQPALEGIGFDSTDHASEHLCLPVITTLNHEAQEAKEKKVGIANTIVRVAEVVLFAFLLLITLICLVQADIRETMFANPLHGLSKISALFFG